MEIYGNMVKCLLVKWDFGARALSLICFQSFHHSVGLMAHLVFTSRFQGVLNMFPSSNSRNRMYLFPECVARVPVSLWGGWAVFARRCATVRNRPQPSATFRNRPQPFATVRNRSREGRMAVPMVSSAKGVTFGGFQRCIASFRVAGVALCDIPTCYMTCQKWFCVAGAILLQRFGKMRCIFLGRRSTLDTLDVILRGRRRRVVLRVFCESNCQRCAKWWQGANSVAGVAFCDMSWKSTEASHETSSLRSVRKKTRRKTSILKLQMVKCKDVSHEMPVLMPQHVSSRVAGFFGAVAVSMWEAAKPIFVEGFKTGCHVVLRGRRDTSWHFHLFANASKIVLCGRRNTFASLSEVDLQFSWQAQHVVCRVATVLPVFLQIAMSGLHHVVTHGDTQYSAIHTPHFIPYTLHFTLHTLDFTLHTLHFTLYTQHFTLHTLHFTLYSPHLTLHTLHFTLHTVLSTLYTPHFTLYTPHFTLYSPHFTLYIPHFTLYTLHSTLYTLHFTLHTLHSTLSTLHFTFYSPHFTLKTFNSTLYTPHLTPYTLHFTLHTLHFTFHTPHFTLHTLHFPLHFLDSTLYTLHFTLHTLHSTLSTLHFTFRTLHSILYTLHSTLYTLHSTLYCPHLSPNTWNSTLYIPHSTLYTSHFILNTWNSTLYTPHFTLHTLHFTFHTSHLTLHTLHFTFHTLHFTLYTPHFTLYILLSTPYTPHFTLDTPHCTLHTLHSALYTPHFTLHTLHFTLHTLHFTLHTVLSTPYS